MNRLDEEFLNDESRDAAANDSSLLHELLHVRRQLAEERERRTAAEARCAALESHLIRPEFRPGDAASQPSGNTPAAVGSAEGDEDFGGPFCDGAIFVDNECQVRRVFGATADPFACEMVGKRIADRVDSDSRLPLQQSLDAAMNAGERLQLTLRGSLLIDAVRSYDARIVPQISDGRVVGAAIYLFDITAQCELERRLRQLEVQLNGLFRNAAMGIGVCEAKGDFKPIRANAALRKMLTGDARAELPKRFLDAVHPNDRGLFIERLNRLVGGHREKTQRELQFLTKNGSFVGRFTGVLSRGNESDEIFLVFAIEDLSALREMQQQLASNEVLLRCTIDRHDRERRNLAIDLHDHVVQSLFAVQMTLDGIAGQIASQNSKLADRLEMSRRSLTIALNTGRRLFNELRPMAIDSMDFTAAMKHLIDELSSLYGLDITFESNLLTERFEDRTEESLFQLLGEALKNVCTHSQASSAHVAIREADNRLILQIVDQGVGFIPEEVKGDCFGLRVMGGRIQLMRGEFEVKSAPGMGTTITANVPARRPNELKNGQAKWAWEV